MIKVSSSVEVIPYKRLVPVRGRMLVENTFLKVQVLEKDYYLSLLPGLHQLTLSELEFKIKKFFEQYELNFSHIQFDKKFFNLISTQDDFLNSLHSESLFNIESILLGMIEKTHSHLFYSDKDAVKINELYSEAGDYKNSQCLKIKISPKNYVSITALISSLTKENPLLKFRLDGNRRFELSELVAFTDYLKMNLSPEAFLQLDYIEEPLKNFYETFLFEKRSALTIAVDESFENYFNNYLFSNPVVIKPSLFGISPIFSWLKNHSDNRAIISSSFEHPTIMHGLYFLASNRLNEFHGLEVVI